jgi:hypothetical protein
MILLHNSIPEINKSRLALTDTALNAIYRLITFSRKYLADGLLDSILSIAQSFKEDLGIKNAPVEAQNQEEATLQVNNLNKTLKFITQEINKGDNFKNKLQFFQLFRLTSPESQILHPNKYRPQLVKIGSYLCPNPKEAPSLVNELFHKSPFIKKRVMRANKNTSICRWKWRNH